MADNKKYYKKYINESIELDPTLFIKALETKTPDGFGGYTTIKENIEIKGRLYKNGRNLTFVQDAGVSISTSLTVKVLFEADALVNEGDRLTAGVHEYKVALCKNYFDVCKQAELEVIK